MVGGSKNSMLNNLKRWHVPGTWMPGTFGKVRVTLLNLMPGLMADLMVNLMLGLMLGLMVNLITNLMVSLDLMLNLRLDALFAYTSRAAAAIFLDRHHAVHTQRL